MPLPKITLSSGTSPIEGKIGSYVITLDSPAPAAGLTVYFDTTASTATFGTDYEFSAGNNLSVTSSNSLTLAPGATAATLNLVAHADGVIDPQEKVILKLIPGADYEIVKFAPKTDLAIHNAPYAIRAADFNGDGKTDLAITNVNDNAVTISLGYLITNTNQEYATGEFPISVSSGDFNADGKIDLAVANYFSNTVSVFLRNTDNTDFQAKTDIITGNFPYAVTVGDVNGDGKEDLVTANKNSNTVSIVLRNASNSGFEAKQDIIVGASPTDVAVGDFNGDGKTDFAVVNADNDNVSVFLRNVSNTGFEASQSFMTGIDPWSIGVGDFNGDAKTDLAVANYASNTVSVLLRNAANTGFEGNVDYATGKAPTSIAVADFNNDGKTDLAVVNADSNSVSVLLRNNANTGFDSKVDIATGILPESFSVGDFNKDGKADFAVTNIDDGTVSLLQNLTSSQASLTIQQPLNHPLNGTVSINDVTPEQGQTLTALNTFTDADGLASITYCWFANKQLIGTGSSYTVTANELGKTLNVTARCTDNLGNTENRSSANTSKVYITLNGTIENNLLSGGAGDDLLSGNAGNDTLNGGLGNDVLNGGDNADKLNGSLGNDILNGDLDNDTLDGGLGNDTLNGNEGNDILLGGIGVDVLTGGQGADIFKFLSTDIQATVSITNIDTISDFETGIDKVNLSLIDANTEKTGNNAFLSITVGDGFSNAFTAPAELYFDSSSHILYANNDSDAAADFAILLVGITTLSKTDFVL